MSRVAKGFTFYEVIIAIVVLGVLGLIAGPAYMNFLSRSYFKDVIEVTAPYKQAVLECFEKTNKLVGCNGGTYTIPANISKAKPPVASLVVVNGVITVAPVPTRGVLATDDYVQTPTIVKNKLEWKVSGGAIKSALADGG